MDGLVVRGRPQSALRNRDYEGQSCAAEILVEPELLNGSGFNCFDCGSRVTVHFCPSVVFKSNGQLELRVARIELRCHVSNYSLMGIARVVEEQISTLHRLTVFPHNFQIERESLKSSQSHPL